MIELKYDQVNMLANEAIKVKGEDYVYIDPSGNQAGPHNMGGCWYVHGANDLTPGCIVGHIIHAAGVSLEDLREREMGASTLLESLENAAILKADKASRIYLIMVQRAQDLGTPWGAADMVARSAVSAMNDVSE